MREDVEDGPHDEQSDGSVGSLEDVLGVVVRLVVVVGLLDLLQQLLSVLHAELLAPQLLPAVKLRQRSLHYPGVFYVKNLVIDVGSETVIVSLWSLVMIISYWSPPHRLSMLAKYSSLAEARLTRLLASIVTSNIDFGSGIVLP